MIFDKTKADYLLSKGFKYTKKTIDTKEAYIFIQTKELMELLSSTFDQNSFVISKTIKF